MTDDSLWHDKVVWIIQSVRFCHYNSCVKKLSQNESKTKQIS